MLTKEENERLTRVGRGAPAGELLRRYWMPVATARELSDENPTRFVRVLGEDLILFRDKSGNVGLIADHCAHRGASLLYGRVEERGIACAYHGWLYDTAGNCLECPAEPAGSMFHLTVKHKAYPVRAFVGLYWAYMGPLPAPEIPRYDAWADKELRRRITVRRIDCNWLQAMENSMDPAHLQILHQDAGTNADTGQPRDTTRGRTDDVASLEFYEVPYGIMKKRVYRNGLLDEHPLIFPNILRHQGTQIRAPIDDTHTMHYTVSVQLARDGEPEQDEDDIPVVESKPHKVPADALYPDARFTMADVAAQDYMAWETQGAIPDRTVERLATSDRGVVLFRQVLKREIERVEQGQDPLGVVRDPDHAVIDTKVVGWLKEYVGRPRNRAEDRRDPVRA
ncbi:MAG: Rieske 2Fe-2S domain-containing protein [Chloroflexi bacterium]|nr:Rieske 2Fe-2S domain-containing protein [Chloroflexota bacterium]